MVKPFILVFLGGGLGSLCRYILWLLMRPWQVHFPWATLVANVAACLLFGLFIAWQGNGWLSDDRRLLLITGFCGGFSTYSTFTSESWGLWQSGHPLLWLIYVVGQFFLCTAALLLGLRLGA
ncbi:MAG: CrcB family protein [Saprospiraceae bacterium]|nr:CrcB family protein [Saprospiraceae bacterium]MDW8483615.1 CrcB family protein [Saprospiraceae bacterium]